MTWRHVPMALTFLLLTAAAASAQGVRIERPQPLLVDVVGNGWTLRYGTGGATIAIPYHVVPLGSGRIVFTHGPWLRLIDAAKGVVVGRWRFPNMIGAVSQNADGTVNVQFRLAPGMRATELTVVFNPADPRPPGWDIGALASIRVAEWEAFNHLRTLSAVQDPWTTVIPDAAAAVPAFEGLVARDPGAPLLRLALAKLLRDAGDVRADAVFRDVLNLPSGDFTEWFRISSILDRLPSPEPALAEAAFERAFTQFIRSGRDPRLLDTLIARLVLYPVGDLSTAPQSSRERYLERIYRLGPISEATDRAWALHAIALERQGRHQEAAVWRQRADESARNASNFSIATQLAHDRLVLLAIAAAIAAVLWILTRQVKYSPQRRMRAVAAMRSGHGSAGAFGLRFWNRRERWSLAMLAMVGWIATGLSWTYARILFGAASAQIHVGSFSDQEDLERYPATPERTLLQAIANHTSGNTADAEMRYRTIPQFAESWNNLGVILASQGKTVESRDAFGRALAIDGSLEEARFNLNGEADSHFTQTFKTHALPDSKLIALPGRDRIFAAWLGDLWTRRYMRMWLGPLDAFATVRMRMFFAQALVLPTLIAGSVLVVVALLAVILLTLVRREEITVTPGRASRILEGVVPGTSTVWSWSGALVLLIWTGALVAAGLQMAILTPYIFIAVAQPGLTRAFGYATNFDDLNPPMPLLIAVVISISAVNVALAMMTRRRTARIQAG